MKKLILTIALSGILGIQYIMASVQSEIEAANKDGKAVFLVVTEPGVTAETKALTLAKGAQTINPKSAVIKMNRSDKSNDELVIKYQLSGAQLPVILVIASNGVLAGGALLSNATSEKIAAMIPSAKKADVLKAMQEKKSVFLVVSKKSHKSKKEVVSKCQIACAEMKENAKIIEVDFDDVAEKSFLTDLKITSIGSEPQTYVINSGGQIAGSFTGVTDSKTLIATTTKKVTGCCPPGSNKSCAPAKKP